MAYYLIMSHQEGEKPSTRKITIGLSKIKKGMLKTLYLETLTQREIGVMQKIMSKQCGKFYNKKLPMIMLFGTFSYSKKIVEIAGKTLGLISSERKGINEVGIDKFTNKTIIKINKNI